MGKAHSNAYCQVAHFYDCPYPHPPPLLCGRDAASLAAMADRWGWEETSTDWRSAIDARGHRRRRHRAAESPACGGRDCGGASRQDRPLREAAGAVARRGDARWPTPPRGVPTLVWFNYRRVPAIAYARQLIDAGTPRHDLPLRRRLPPAVGSRHVARRHVEDGSARRPDPGVADDLLTHLLDTALYLNGPVHEGDRRRANVRRPTADRRRVHGDAEVRERQRRARSRRRASAIGCKNPNSFQMHGSGGMLRFNLERLNHLEFLDASTPSVEQGARDLLVTDMKHPVFPNFWRPGHIIGYEHTFIATLAEFLDALSRGATFHPDFADASRCSGCSTRCSGRRRHGSGRRIELRETRRLGRTHLDARRRYDHEHSTAVGLLVEDAVDDRRAALRVDRDQPARPPDRCRCSRRCCATRIQVDQRAVRLHRGRLQARHDGRPGAGRLVHGPRRHAHRPGDDLRRLVVICACTRSSGRRSMPRRSGPGCRVAGSPVHRPALPDGPGRVRQLHRRHQGARRPVSRRQPLPRRRGLQRGRAVRIGHRAAVRAVPAQRTVRRERADGVHHSDGARAALAAAVARRSFPTRRRMAADRDQARRRRRDGGRRRRISARRS